MAIKVAIEIVIYFALSELGSWRRVHTADTSMRFICINFFVPSGGVRRVYLPTSLHDHCCYSEQNPQKNKNTDRERKDGNDKWTDKERSDNQACLAERNIRLQSLGEEREREREREKIGRAHV